VLTPQNYAHVEKLGKKLVDGYRKTIAKVGLQAYVASAGANGALMLYSQEIRNYRDWITIDTDLWRQYWFGMVNRGVMPQPHWWDEQWTISVQHSEAGQAPGGVRKCGGRSGQNAARTHCRSASPLTSARSALSIRC
jgi:glutamate-1-semialdehyde 2,1-aminomutase